MKIPKPIYSEELFTFPRSGLRQGPNATDPCCLRFLNIAWNEGETLNERR